MKLRERRIGLLVLVTAASLSVTGATTRPLNPLVARTPSPGVAPADCNESLTPAPRPRIAVQEVPPPEIEPAEAPAPPSGSLRAALQEAQSANARNDRRAFDASLARARSLVANYPTGAERRSGEELLRVYEGVALLWDAQYRSPFFSEDSREYQIVSGYPGYREAVRRNMITDRDGQRFYPAVESRDFLGRIAADRLRGIGIQAPTRVAGRERATSRPRTTTTTTTTPPQTAPQVATARPPRRVTTTTTTGTVRPPRPRRTAPAIASRSRTTETTTPSTSTPAPVTSAPGNSPNPPATPTTAAAPTPATPEPTETAASGAASPAAGESPAPADATSPTVGEDVPTTATTDTSMTSAPVTGTTETPSATPSRARSVVLPTILILIGLVVLIVLFRASK